MATIPQEGFARWGWAACIRQPQLGITSLIADGVANSPLQFTLKAVYDVLWLQLPEPCRTLQKWAYEWGCGLYYDEIVIDPELPPVEVVLTEYPNEWLEIYDYLQAVDAAGVGCERIQIL